MNRECQGNGRRLRRALIVALSAALAVPGLAGRDRKGDEVTIKMQDAQVVQGELLAVRGDDLIVLDRRTAAEVTMSLLEIEEIKVVSRSERTSSAVVGAVLNGAIAGLCGALSQKDNPGQMSWAAVAALGTIPGGFVGYLIGGVGHVFRPNKYDPAQIKGISARLKKYARDRG